MKTNSLRLSNIKYKPLRNFIHWLSGSTAPRLLVLLYSTVIYLQATEGHYVTWPLMSMKPAEESQYCFPFSLRTALHSTDPTDHPFNYLDSIIHLNPLKAAVFSKKLPITTISPHYLALPVSVSSVIMFQWGLEDLRFVEQSGLSVRIFIHQPRDRGFT